MLHQKLWSKHVSFRWEGRKQGRTYMKKKSPIGKIFKSPPPKDRRKGLRILLKTSVRGGGGTLLWGGINFPSMRR